jgi:tetratricopeptide (TPR) repeat protein
LKQETLSEPILVGRNRELQELLSLLDATTEQKGTTIFISGEAGSGKTKLSQEFIKIARLKGAIVLDGWCLSNAQVPYFPFLEAFNCFSENSLNRGSSGNQQLVLKKWFNREETAKVLTAQAWQDQTFATIIKDLFFLSVNSPVVLFIDDLHWADSASLSLLHYIARSSTSERILIIGTFRSEEIQKLEGHPLAETLRLMSREGLFKEIKLSGLSQTYVGLIAENMLCGNVHSTVVERLSVETRGLPLYIIELLRMLFEKGEIFRKDNVWRISTDKIGIPDKVKDIILRRLESLKPEQRRILNAASVVGEIFDPKIVEAVVCQDGLSVLEALEAIANNTLLVFGEGDIYRFEHARFREMLYAQIPLSLRREYHSLIARILEEDERFSKKIHVSDLAYHYKQAGNKEKLVKYALAAGRDALVRFSNQEALEYFKSVLENISSDQDSEIEKKTALEGLGEAYFASSMFKQASITFQQLADISDGVSKLVALRRSMDSAFFQGDFSQLWDLTIKAEILVANDRLESARVLMNRARANTFFGDHAKGRREFKQALIIFEEEGSLPDVARVSLGLGGVHEDESPDWGLALALQAVNLYDNLGDARGLMDAYNRAGQSFGYRLLIREALAMHEKAVMIGEKIGDFNRVLEAKASSAYWFEVIGDTTQALAFSLKGLEYCKNTESDWSRGMIYSNLVRQYSKLGDMERAEFYFEKLESLPKTVLSNFAFTYFELTKAVFLAGKQMWFEVNRFFKEGLSRIDKAQPSAQVLFRTYYAWVLNRQNNIREANNQLIKAQTIVSRYKSLEQSSLMATLIIPRQLEIGKKYLIYLTIINVNSTPCQIIEVRGLTNQGVILSKTPEIESNENGIIKLKDNHLDPYAVKSIQTTFQLTEPGCLTIIPMVHYSDYLGQEKVFAIKKITLTSKSVFNGLSCIKSAQKFEPAKKAFDYLVSAFIMDYYRLKLPQEKSGWRTLMDIVKGAKISKHNMYGTSRARGKSLVELKRLGLVEDRFFSGERGRGGLILKLRIVLNNEAVKECVQSNFDKKS